MDKYKFRLYLKYPDLARRVRKTYTVIIIFFTALLISSCGREKIYVPRPRIYPKLTFPVKTYTVFDDAKCAFSFEYPAYASIEQDSTFFGEKNSHPCWFDVVFPDFNGRLHCSYYEINEDNSLDSLIYDAFKLVGKHMIKARYIEETKIKLAGSGAGIFFKITGPVASPSQFFVTDSTEHFLRGSLYFNNKVQVDSMAVIHEFINQDVKHMLETLNWN